LQRVLTVLIAVSPPRASGSSPKLVRSQAQDFVSENYKRALSVGEIRFNPFTFELEVKDLSLPDADGQVLASFDRLLVNPRAFEHAGEWGRASRRSRSTGPLPRADPRERGPQSRGSRQSRFRRNRRIPGA
jgi:hypothetical protein